MDVAIDSSLLSPAERPAARVYNAGGRGQAVLVCEHASRFIPASLADLGLDEEALASHVAWDIGALEVAKSLSVGLDAPLVAARISRLVYDCNRAPKAPDAMPAQSERFAVPGNAALTDAERTARAREVYEPFGALVSDTIERHRGAPVLITVHSFTPVYLGRRRRVEIGVLHDDDTRLADAMLACADRHTPRIVGRNDPYGPEAGVTHTLRRHAIARDMANVMLEIRNDLLPDREARRGMGRMLAGWLGEAMEKIGIRGGRSTREPDQAGAEPPCPA